MAVLFTTNRDRQQAILEAIKCNRAIEPLADGWSIHDLLNVAGAILAVAKATPIDCWVDGTDARSNIQSLHYERQEHELEVLHAEILSAIHGSSELSMLRMNESWDRFFGSDVIGKAWVEGDYDVHRWEPADGQIQPGAKDESGS